MKVLIIGGGGMLGHQLWRQLNPNHEVWTTLRKSAQHYAEHGLFGGGRVVSGLDVSNGDALAEVFQRIRPEAVINCVGIIKQLKEAKDPILSLSINSMLPHRLARLCGLVGARLVHISTDCVFSGRRGSYTEADVSDAEDLYGRTKFLGEVHEEHCITLRTSIIGRELESSLGLIDWFLSQNGKTIRGYRKAIYTGFTTMELARVIETVLLRHGALSGLWQVSSDPINKFELLKLAQSKFGWTGEIVPDDTFVCDRSLDSRKFRAAAGYVPPDWDRMLGELAGSRA